MRTNISANISQRQGLVIPGFFLFKNNNNTLIKKILQTVYYNFFLRFKKQYRRFQNTFTGDRPLFSFSIEKVEDYDGY